MTLDQIKERLNRGGRVLLPRSKEFSELIKENDFDAEVLIKKKYIHITPIKKGGS